MTEAPGWEVYILRGSDSSLYTGITTDLERRLDEHNNSSKGAKALRGKRPLKMVWHRESPNRSEASRLEAKIKSLTKKNKERLVEGSLPSEALLN
jgi:putative endonuclease